MLSFDVVIVGAGPAGCAAALSIMKHAPHLSLLVVDRAVFPRDKVCGDGLGPGVKEILDSLDALSVIEDDFRPPSVRVGGPGGWEGYAEGPTIRGKDLSGYVVPRIEFDNRLLTLVKSRGATVWEDTKFLSSEAQGDFRTVDLDRAGHKENVETRFLVGADGAYSRVRRTLGIAKSSEAHTHIAMRSYAEIASAEDGEPGPPMRIDFDEELLPAYGWVFPVSPSIANIGVGVPISLLKNRSLKLRSLMDRYVQSLAERGVHVIRVTGEGSHQLPHAADVPALVHNRAVLIGDAGSMINSLSGEGIVYGMAAGQMLGEWLGASVDASTDDEMLQGFETEFRKRYHWHFVSCWVGHQLLRSPTWARAVIKATSKDQEVMNDAAELLFNEGVIRVGTTLRIFRSGILGLDG